MITAPRCPTCAAYRQGAGDCASLSAGIEEATLALSPSAQLKLLVTQTWRFPLMYFELLLSVGLMTANQ